MNLLMIAHQTFDPMPTVEIRSKTPKDGQAIWKQVRATIDTGTIGNLISAQMLERLGMLGDELLPLTDEESSILKNRVGAEVDPLGALELTWRARRLKVESPHTNKIFKTRFVVTAADRPFEILLGWKSISDFESLLSDVVYVGGASNLGVLETPQSQSQGRHSQIVL